MKYTMTFDINMDENNVEEFIRTLEVELAKMEMADEPVNFSISNKRRKVDIFNILHCHFDIFWDE